jgi:hypothetical protein
MRRNLIRHISVGTALAVVAAAAAGAAFAASKAGHDRFTVRGGLPGLNGARDGGFGAFGGPGFGGRLPGRGPGFGGPGFGFVGPVFDLPERGFGGPGGGILAADLLTPAAAFLNITVTDLAADLKGGKTLAQEATAKGKKPADLIDAIVAAEKKVLDADVAAGWITSDQASSVLSGLTKQITGLVNDGPPVPATEHAGLLDTAATYLGLSVSDLQSKLKAGKTLADVTATVSGKTVEGLVAALEGPAKKELDVAVTAGKITQAQETTILSNITSRLTDLVNGKAGDKEAASVKGALLKLASLKGFSVKASTAG